VGLHARPAAAFVQAATAGNVPVLVAKGDGTPVDSRSILAVMALGAKKGDELTLTAEDDSAVDIVERLATIVATDMDEAN
jgi:phosphocarrier protein